MKALFNAAREIHRNYIHPYLSTQRIVLCLERFHWSAGAIALSWLNLPVIV